MKVLSLGLSGTPDEIRAKLQQDCRTLVHDGFRIAIDETNKGSYTFLACNIAEGELSFRNYERVKVLLRNYVAQLLADIIVYKEEKNLIRRIIDRNYYYLSEEERGHVHNTTLEILGGSAGICGDFNSVMRRNLIFGRVQEYFDNHHELVLEGFILFRLKDYRERLAEIVDKAVDEYMLDLEYKEFIRVLRYFVDVQEAQVEEVHVVIGDGDGFKLRDARGKIINNKYLETFVSKDPDEINYEDLLISALITIAPRNVMLHCANQARAQNIVTTIRNVFEGRVVLCEGCDICHADFFGQFTP
jgi:putative sporulation protein YtxC